MLTCIACSKQQPGGAPPLREPLEDEEDDDEGNAFAGGRGESAATPSTRHAIKSLTSQVSELYVKHFPVLGWVRVLEMTFLGWKN